MALKMTFIHAISMKTTTLQDVTFNCFVFVQMAPLMSLLRNVQAIHISSVQKLLVQVLGLTYVISILLQSFSISRLLSYFFNAFLALIFTQHIL